MRHATPLCRQSHSRLFTGYGGTGPGTAAQAVVPSLGTLNVASATQSGPRLGADTVTSASALVGARNATRCTSSTAF